MIGLGSLAVAVLSVASLAFACTTYQGKMTVVTAGGTSVAQGDNNCTATCGDPNGSMMFCGSVSFGAVYDDSAAATATITLGTTDNCPSTQNHLNGSTDYGINIRKTQSMTNASGGTTITDPEDCMDWTVGNGTTHIVTVPNIPASGAFTTVVNLPTGTFSNTSGWSSGICVSDKLSWYGNQAPIKVI